MDLPGLPLAFQTYQMQHPISDSWIPPSRFRSGRGLLKIGPNLRRSYKQEMEKSECPFLGGNRLEK